LQEAMLPLQTYIEKFGNKDKLNLWRVYLAMSQFLFTKEQSELALENITKAYELAPDDKKKDLEQTRAYLYTNQIKN